jgi:von Willebrand factor type A domain
MPAEPPIVSETLITRKPRPWWKTRPFLFVSVGVHLVFLLGASYFVVSRYTAARKLTFSAGPKSPNPTERALQHRVKLQERSKIAPPPSTKRVLSTGRAKIILPPLPSLPASKEAGPAPLLPAAGNAVTFGTRPGTMGSVGGTGTGAAINFFGIRDVSRNVVIVVDVSDSMFGRTGDADYESRKLVRHGKEQNFQAVRDEAIKLVEGLTPNTYFGIVRFSGGAYSWKPELVPATEENKQAAIAHIQTKLDYHKASKKQGRPGGTRHDYALETAFKLKPEGGVIYLLTDGNATGESIIRPGQPITPQDIFKVAQDGQKTLSRPAKIHTIYYVTGADQPEERQMLMTLSAQNGGKFTSVEAKGRKG